TPASFTTAPSLMTVPAGSHAGSYDITASGAVDADYTISYAKGTLSITPAALTISANDKSMVYGGTLPALTASYSGLVNGDTPASLTTAPTLATVPATSNVGIYAITANSAVDADYAIQYVNGVLTICPRALSITANSVTKVYGQSVSFADNEFTTSGLVQGDK